MVATNKIKLQCCVGEEVLIDSEKVDSVWLETSLKVIIELSPNRGLKNYAMTD